MVNPASLGSAFDQAIQEIGQTGTLRYYTFTARSGTDWDEEYLPQASGITISGGFRFEPIGQSEAEYLRQGIVKRDDHVVFMSGSLTTSGANFIVNLGGGSVYSVLPEGIERWAISGVDVYQKCFMRFVNNGSLIGVF